MDENSDSRFRGTANYCVVVFYMVGMLAVTGVASLLQWRLVAWLAVIGPIAAFILTHFIPESAMWLVRHGRQEEAILVLERLWGKSHRVKVSKDVGRHILEYTGCPIISLTGINLYLDVK